MKDRKLKKEQYKTEADSVSDTSGSGGATVKKRKSFKDAVYDFRVKLHRATHKKTGVKRIGQRKRNDIIFYCLMLAFPVVQFCIFYIGVNFNSILLTFKKYDFVTGQWSFAGFENISKVLSDISSQYVLIQSAKNSLICYFVGLITGVPLSLFFSYYIYKKMPLQGFFKVMLFMPSVISSIAMVVMFSYFVENAYPAIMQKLFGLRVEGLIANPESTFGTILFYSVWSGFGTSILMYSGAMNSISDSVVEAAKLEGVTPLKEFFKITLPLIYPTLVTFLVVGIAGIFTNQMNLFSFFGAQADYRIYTFGYYLYKNTQEATMDLYPYLAAMGLLMTLVAVPVTLLVRYLLEKFGPKVD